MRAKILFQAAPAAMGMPSAARRVHPPRDPDSPTVTIASWLVAAPVRSLIDAPA